MNRYAGQSIVVLGLGETGLSLARWLTREGARVTVADTREVPPKLEELRALVPDARVRAGAFDDDLFRSADMIAVSPGVPKAQPSIERAVSSGLELAGDVELFARALRPAQRVIAITGSNGKSTVTTLVGELCRAAGLNALVAGNIGLPVLDALARIEDSNQWPDVIVLELSSFQLETTLSLNAGSATVLNVSEDHFDRYRGMDDYAAAKARVFRGEGVQVLNRDDSRVMAMACSGRRALTFGVSAPETDEQWGILVDSGVSSLARGTRRLVPAGALALVGRHNAMNALAALALIEPLALPETQLLPALCSFGGLPHRVEPIAKHDGVVYIDDSKGTNVGATIAALQGLDRPVILIAGGDGKGQDFSLLRAAVDGACRAVVLIGRDAAQIESALSGSSVRRERALTLPEAVLIASELAREGDAVLLSPACASFDMFRDYLHRSEVFAFAVNALASKAATHA